MQEEGYLVNDCEAPVVVIILVIAIILLAAFFMLKKDICLTDIEAVEYTPYFYEYNICGESCEANGINCWLYCEEKYLTDEKWDYKGKCR